MALYASVIGDAISDILTLLLIGLIARIILLIGPPEVFAIIVFSLILIASVSGDPGSRAGSPPASVSVWDLSAPSRSTAKRA